MSNEYCIYLRKSRSDEKSFEHSEQEVLKRHEKTLISLGKKLNLNITKIYREVVSGDTIACRPVVQELLSSVEMGEWSGVLVMEIERLARGDTIDQGIISQTFKYSNTKIITPIKTYDPNDEFDEEYFEFGLFMSRREYKVINRRLQRGRIASVKEGKFVGNIPPYGYDRVKLDNSKGYKLVPNQDERETVKIIYDLYVNKKFGTSKIAEYLDNLLIKPRITETWSPETITGILKNPVYIGKIRWDHRKSVKKIINGERVLTRPRNTEGQLICDGLHEPIIEEELFREAQDIMSGHLRPPVGLNKKISNPLAGLIVCSKCDHKMVKRPYTNQTPPGLICVHRGCTNIGSELTLVETRIIDSLRIWLDNYKLSLRSSSRKLREPQNDIIENQIIKIQNDLKTTSGQLNTLYDLLEQGVYSPDVFLQRSKMLSVRKSELEAKLQVLLSSQSINTKIQSEIEFVPRVEKLLETYYGLSDAASKNAMLKDVIEKVIYTKEKKGTKKCHDNFELVIYPKLPNTEIKSLPN